MCMLLMHVQIQIQITTLIIVQIKMILQLMSRENNNKNNFLKKLQENVNIMSDIQSTSISEDVNKGSLDRVLYIIS